MDCSLLVQGGSLDCSLPVQGVALWIGAKETKCSKNLSSDL